MKLLTLTLENFRQFHGENSIEFSSDDDKPFTICYAVNGGGKTTVLSALHYVFAGGDLKYINKPAAALNASYFANTPDGEPLSFSIALRFEQRGEQFEVRRTRMFRKEGELERYTGETLELTDSSGTLVTPAQKNLNNVFPPSLSKFFFFPGEELDNFFDLERLKQLQSDVEVIYDLHIYKRLAKLVRATSAELARRLRSTNVGENLREALGLKERASAALSTARDQLVTVESELSDAEGEVSRCENILEANVQARSAVQQKREAESKLSGAMDLISSSERSQATIRIVAGYGLLTKSLNETVTSRLANLREHGQVGGSFGPRQIAELLHSDGNCVCGRSIGPSEREALESRLEAHVHSFGGAPYADLERELKDGALNGELVASRMRASFRERENADEAKALALIQIEESATVLVGVSEDSLTATFDDLLKFSKLVRDFNEKKTTLEARIEEAETKLDEALRQISLCNEEDVSARVPTLQIAYLDRLSTDLEAEITGIQSNVKMELEAELNDLIPSFLSVANAEVSVNENLMPIITPDLGEAQGQSQAKAIAMMIALNRIANRRANSLDDFNLVGPTEFPLVIDSAFGQLGFEYRELVASQLSANPSQVVLLVTDSQSAHVVDSIGAGKCGKQWLFQVHEENSGNNYEFTLGGRTVIGKVRNSPPLRTEILEVS